jgi:[FeFe] hydrogenase H-cluster maturation GTPase HydF
MNGMTKGKETKPHIGIFGRRNNGKSSLINVLAGFDTAIVSAEPGTTTDPVKKSMEIPGIGPAILIDTAGIDDTGELGLKRINKSFDTLKVIDLAVLLITGNSFGESEENLIAKFEEYKVPFVIISNKSDITPLSQNLKIDLEHKYQVKVFEFSAVKSNDNNELLKLLAEAIPETAYTSNALVGGLFKTGETVLLITPIDNEAPEGRMILPQVQAIRDILDNDGIPVLCKENDVEELILNLKPRPSLVITDSQVFGKVSKFIPRDIPFTSFSILLARQRGDFDNYLKGTPYIDKLNDGDRILILESCSHHVSCDDIGRHKIPAWMRRYTGKKLEFDVVAGLGNTQRDIGQYAMVVQCGGCVITRKQVINRVKPAVDAGIPITNYGMAIAWMHGIFMRAVELFENK